MIQDVEIMGGEPGTRGRYLSLVKDIDGNRYFAPVFPDDPYRTEVLGKEIARDIFLGKATRVPEVTKEFIKQIIKDIHSGETTSANEEDFERIWPAIKAKQKKTINPKSPILAIFDTGIMHDHPLLKDCIVESVDFTGEGIEDFNGHGTMSALIAQVLSPFKNRFISVKVVGADGRGSSDDLVKGIHWLIEYKRKQNIEVFANFSIGVYSKKWGLFECQGNCKVCNIAMQAANQGIVICAAAGNTPGLTSCPARAAMLNKHPIMLVVAGYNYDKSGIGQVKGVATISQFTQVYEDN
jgi:hypothetical protein